MTPCLYRNITHDDGTVELCGNESIGDTNLCAHHIHSVMRHIHIGDYAGSKDEALAMYRKLSDAALSSAVRFYDLKGRA